MILVTGASGYVGSMALRHLSAMGHPVAAMARNARKARQTLPPGVALRVADYDDIAGLEKAFEAVTDLLFISSDGDRRDVMRHHANVIDAAAACGVEHVVFTSIIDVGEASPFYFAPVYRDAERRLTERGLATTMLRCGLYADLVLASWVEPAISTGVLSLPVGQGRVAPVSRDDVAIAAAQAVVSPHHLTKVHELTGPKSYSFDEIAGLASRFSGVPVQYVPCSASDYLRRGTDGDGMIRGQKLFRPCAHPSPQGRYGIVSPGISDLVGRPAEGLDEFLPADACTLEALVW